MSKFEDFYKDSFDKVQLSQREEETMKNNIIKQYKKVKTRNRIVSYFIVVISICVVGFGIVKAEKIGEFIKDVFIRTKTDEKGNVYTHGEVTFVKEMNYDADIPEIERSIKGNMYDRSELEKLLGMKFLKSDYFKTDNVEQRATKKVDDKIAFAEFAINDFVYPKEEDTIRIGRRMDMYFSTKYNDNHTSTFSMSPGVTTKKYFIKNLNTIATILLINHTEADENISMVITEFVYDDVGYMLWLHFFRRPTTEEGMKEIKDLLDSFSY